MKMKEILKKLLDAGKKDALNSLEEMTEAAKELGYSEDEVEKALDDFDGFPIDDDDLLEITGGLAYGGTPYRRDQNRTF
ncbi:MAG: hypothetical protein K6E91_03700 [Butyrivibrio sp.]|nr:hypothetical protein [Butyrivibrio sp.]